MAHLGIPHPAPGFPAQEQFDASAQQPTTQAPTAGGLTIPAQDLVTTPPGAAGTEGGTQITPDILGGQRQQPFTQDALSAAAELTFGGQAGFDPLSLTNLGLQRFPGADEFRRISGELGISGARGQVTQRREERIASLLAIPGIDEKNVREVFDSEEITGLEGQLQTVDQQLEQARVEVQKGVSQIALNPNVTQFQKQRALQLAADVGKRSIEQLEAQRQTISGELDRVTDQQLKLAGLEGTTAREQAAALGEALGLDEAESAELERILQQELTLSEDEFLGQQQQQIPGLLGQILGPFGELFGEQRGLQQDQLRAQTGLLGAQTRAAEASARLSNAQAEGGQVELDLAQAVYGPILDPSEEGATAREEFYLDLATQWQADGLFEDDDEARGRLNDRIKATFSGELQPLAGDFQRSIPGIAEAIAQRDALTTSGGFLSGQPAGVAQPTFGQVGLESLNTLLPGRPFPTTQPDLERRQQAVGSSFEQGSLSPLLGDVFGGTFTGDLFGIGR